MLRFLTAGQAHPQPYLSEFRYRKVWTAVALVLTTAITVLAAGGAIRLWGESWLGVGLLGWIALWFLIFALICRAILRARMRPGAWLVRIEQNALLLHFRSYLNHHFSEADNTVVRIPFSEIDWVREHDLRRTIPGGVRSDDETRRQRYIELKTSESNATDLERNLAAERARKGPMRPKWRGNGYKLSRHYPVQVIDNSIIRIEWGVRPGVAEFMKQVAPRLAVQAKTDTDIDFGKLEKLSQEEQERHLIELIETGDRMSAVRAARHLYQFNLTQAVRFVDSLSGHKKGDDA